MRKDIPKLQVENVAVAVVPGAINDERITLWEVYLINMREEDIEGVLVSSRGYGKKEGQDVKTSTIRWSLGTVAKNSYQLIEPIDINLFGLNNEYWLSYYLDGKLYDKKYIFVPESITNDNLRTIPELGTIGVLIK